MSDPQPMVETRDLKLTRGRREVLHGISLALQPGEVVGLIGRNGAGKSSLLETLFGFHAADSGEVYLWGEPARSLSMSNKQRIGFVPQQDELVDGLTVGQQVDLIASFYPHWDEVGTAKLLVAWDLDPARPVRELSLGLRQRLSIILSIGHGPSLLVLDEPVASLDPLARAQFLVELKRLMADDQRSMIFSSHIVTDLEPLVNTVWILDDGLMRWAGPLDRIGSALEDDGSEGASLEDVFMRVVA